MRVGAVTPSAQLALLKAAFGRHLTLCGQLNMKPNSLSSSWISLSTPCGISRCSCLRAAHRCRRTGATVCAAKQNNPFRDSGKKSTNSSSSNKNSKSSSSGGAKKPQFRSRDPPAPKELTISRPLQISLLEESNIEMTAAPLWDTFCNHLSGEWLGQYGAYTPWEGRPEPVWLDSNNKYIDWVYSRSVEHRGADEDGADRFIRKVGRATTLDATRQLPIPLTGFTVDNDDVDVEALSYNSEGVVVFNGGNYSAGPDFIGPPAFKMLQEPSEEEEEAADSNRPKQQNASASSPTSALANGPAAAESEGDSEEDESQSAPTTTSILEQCLVDWGTKTRVRVKATVRIGHTEAGEVDLAIIRLILFREVWAGPVGLSSLQPAQARLESAPCTKLPRPTAADVTGEWSCFTISAVGIEEENPLTGEEGVTWVYSSNQDKQQWELPGREGPEDGADGGTLWLPGGVLVTFRMVDMEAAEDDDEGVEQEVRGSGQEGSDKPPRGLCMGTTWMQPGGQALQLERYYDGEGVLRDVRFTTAVKGGWSGGKM